MVNNVVKRDGHLEPFDKEKMKGSIKKAMIDAKLSVEDIQDEVDRMADYVEESLNEENSVDVSKIRSTVLAVLENKKQVAAAAWRKFDGKYKVNN
jgi:transcriptional regulator NrdR family protein